MWQTALAFVFALLVALSLTPIVRRLALRVGAVDQPVARSVHTEPKPFLGGVAIYAAFSLTILLTVGLESRSIQGLLVGGALIVLLGVIDDFYRLSAKVKFFGQVIAAAVLVVGFGVQIRFIANPFADAAFFAERFIFFDRPWVAAAITIFWIVAVTNIVNLIDGLDGLAAGISSIAAVTILLVALRMEQPQAALLAAALAGAAIGFLRYNFNPAKIFMGDAGAMFLGYALAAVSVLGLLKTAAAAGLLVPVLALGLPILDTALAIVRRVLTGRSIGLADKEHLHHRLLQRGLSHRGAVLVMWTFSGSLGVAAVAVAGLTFTQGMLVLLLIAAATVLGLIKLGIVGGPPRIESQVQQSEMKQ